MDEVIMRLTPRASDDVPPRTDPLAWDTHREGPRLRLFHAHEPAEGELSTRYDLLGGWGRAPER